MGKLVDKEDLDKLNQAGRLDGLKEAWLACEYEIGLPSGSAKSCQDAIGRIIDQSGEREMAGGKEDGGE